ncbi:RlpA-like double-psi beta-barrel-protein domain-containing protein-containing protein [Suillus subalutaceus]|uniref:RlpA-like double-psi beta-barrel-protein domain-containing protein-containing protein n=1 Tax=Suillus subalutaceus TaxID=48586 RepID=UPI001B87EC6B|nr:RlpA-like double-psi beta-barrel-protein domain-containing protein-containing protein [Suillus subalutaceus]KAG1877784.1 RlpA-like double-psi beta-barrel-protein domain-containing protein-containing protein [Suillus subalutaceus]
MRFFTQLSVLLSFVLSWYSVSARSAHQVNRHHGKRLNSDLAVRAPGDVDMYKRDYANSRFTYYAVGLGACGTTNIPTDFIVALNSDQFGSGSYCYQMITITCNGLTAQAQITDECPGCPYAGLDFSQGLFEFFAPLGDGVIYGTWSFGSAPAPAPSPTTTSQPPPPPTTTSQPPPPPTTTWTPPPSSTTSSPSPTSTPSSSSTSSSSFSSSSSSSTSSTFSSSSSSASSSASSTTSADSVVETAGSVGSSSSLMDLNLAMVYLGELLGDAEA